ncbi:M15 family metallopeptidase [Mesonia sp. MT50]|uniref:D-alanyl-D-alanine dipeptidase n=1 Tax=Mesonia profundi TaxID=3070998 RepID=A0ABU1A428_9FLAO|nr:M15 family metallopeptidase [Mesonia profundi]MDQ7918470.1 M15 family metallopeptidase [Mesonia profundi]
MKKLIGFLCGILLGFGAMAQTDGIPQDFGYISDSLPLLVLEIRYAGSHNFTGKPVNGYETPQGILSKPALIQLKKAYQYFLKKGYIFKFFDAYRPQTAVNHFRTWARDPSDTLMKKEFYPKLQKKDLFKLGYISTQSGHSRGSTLDLTLIDLKTGAELDMGSPYDFFGTISHHNTQKITEAQKQNRLLLKQGMRKFGFIAYPKEWWHYTLYNEPFRNTYFDFPIR